MSCAERASYHHGDLRQTLLDAAVRHIREQGTEGLSLRALAREAGVSPTAPYRHFENRTALLAALATEGFRELEERMLAASADAERDPVSALHALGCAYVEYARTHPVKYHLMFGDLIGDFSPFSELLEAAETCYGRLERVLALGLERGLLRGPDLQELGGHTWASVHGIAGLVIAAERKRATQPDLPIEEIRPLCAQQRVLESRERAVARLMAGIVIDDAALAALRRHTGDG